MAYYVEVSRGCWEPVSDLHEASSAVRQWIEYHDLGVSEWTGSGQVTDGQYCLAVVSYNGRVWTPEEDWRQRRELLNG